jgi:hypothetical protein
MLPSADLDDLSSVAFSPDGRLLAADPVEQQRRSLPASRAESRQTLPVLRKSVS